MIKLTRLKRRTQKERLGELKRFTRSDWRRLFPKETRIEKILLKIRPKVEEKILGQSETEIIGRRREGKVFNALRELKKKGVIRDYLSPGKLSYSDLIEGVDCIFVYVDSCYKVCRFSITGRRWIKQHQERHPEIPVFSVDLEESEESIEQKIIFLKNGDNDHFSR